MTSKNRAKKRELLCPKCGYDVPEVIVTEYVICPKCQHKFLSCYPNCDYEDKDGYYCPCFCPYNSAEDDGDDTYDFY